MLLSSLSRAARTCSISTRVTFIHRRRRPRPPSRFRGVGGTPPLEKKTKKKKKTFLYYIGVVEKVSLGVCERDLEGRRRR